MKNVSEIDKKAVTIMVGNRIKEIITEKKYKLRHVAHDADLDVENLRKYIKARQEMKISTLFRILQALDVSVCEFFNDKN